MGGPCNLETPELKTGYCFDFDSPDRESHKGLGVEGGSTNFYKFTLVNKFVNFILFLK